MIVPALNEPLSYLVHQRLLHVRSLSLSQLLLDADQRLLVVLLMHLLRLAPFHFSPRRKRLRRQLQM